MDDNFSHLGIREIWGGEQPFGFSSADRRQHCYVVGQTGTGKSTLLKDMILQDIYAGQGVAVLDPHGDLANDLLDHFPPSRANDLVWFDPADVEYPIAFNILSRVAKDAQHLLASGVIGALKSIWRDSFGPRMEYILHATVLALLDCNRPNISFLAVQRMLSDDQYRRWIVRGVGDPVLRAFWQNEFEEYDDRFRREAVAPIQNKVGQILLAAPVRNIFGQVRSKLDLRYIMDHRKVLIANLSKGTLGEDKSNLIGALLVAQFQQAAMSRATLSPERRQPFYLFIDEFQNFGSDLIHSILSESRKYALSLTVSHQYLEQLSDATRHAVFGNVGNLISFRVGESDAGVMSRQFGDAFTPEMFTSLPNHHVFVRNLRQNNIVAPFRGKTEPAAAVRFNHREKLLRHCRPRFGTPRKVVEERIARWLRPSSQLKKGTAHGKRLQIYRKQAGGSTQ